MQSQFLCIISVENVEVESPDESKQLFPVSNVVAIIYYVVTEWLLIDNIASRS